MPSLLICNRTAPIAVEDAFVLSMKALEKSGNFNTGEVVMAVLSFSVACLHASSHLKSKSLPVSLVRGTASIARFAMHIL